MTFYLSTTKRKFFFENVKYRYFKYNMTFTSLILIPTRGTFQKTAAECGKKFYTQKEQLNIYRYLHNKFCLWKSVKKLWFINI